MIRVIEAMRQRKASFALLQSPGAAPNAKGIKKTPMLLKCIPYPDPDRTKKDECLKIREVDCSTLARAWPHFDFINKAKVFLATMIIAQPNNNDHGISWLELAMLYEYRTGTAIPNDLGCRQDPHDIFP